MRARPVAPATGDEPKKPKSAHREDERLEARRVTLGGYSFLSCASFSSSASSFSLSSFSDFPRASPTPEDALFRNRLLHDVSARPAESSGPIGVVDTTGSYHKEEKEKGRKACCGYYYSHRDLAREVSITKRAKRRRGRKKEEPIDHPSG